jgi:TonB family protein
MGFDRRLYTLVLLGGCATTGVPASEREPVAHAKVTLSPLPGDDTIRLVPQAVDPMLPSADRIARVVEARLGGEATVDIRYCVSPAGKVVEAKLERGSELEQFDQAVMHDIVDWQFEAQAGPDSVRTCDRATIVYRPHRG